MAEKGSDDLLREAADWPSTIVGVSEEEARNAAEEERIDMLPPEDVDEPGEEYPAPDPPPMDEAHDEYDPLPPS